jgi:hypothetical protein
VCLDLPAEITEHLPGGYQPKPGIWLVLPQTAVVGHGIITLNSWIRANDWYPQSLQDVVWFGDDGVGNLLGWRPDLGVAVLWNPEDGAPWKDGSVSDIWRFLLDDYDDGEDARGGPSLS